MYKFLYLMCQISIHFLSSLTFHFPLRSLFSCLISTPMDPNAKSGVYFLAPEDSFNDLAFYLYKKNKIITRKRCLVRLLEEGGGIEKVVPKLEQEKKSGERKRQQLRVLIAGGGIGGLVLALAAKQRGYEVKVFEKDLRVVRGEGRHRGPIQLLSSALSVLEAIDENVAKQIMEAGCVTGNRTNGLADGLSGEWFTKFDLFTPASRKGLPITLVICRMTLQDILVNAVGSNILRNNSKVVNFIQEPRKVRVVLENGQHYDGDILVGADGIWSEVRSKLFGRQKANYSGFTCYSGLTNYVPPSIDTIGYKVFLGLNQYFVASDVGHGKMQWYAFHGEPPSSSHNLEGKKKRLKELFGKWCNEVTTLISETPEHMILQRDIYDRDLINTWGIGRVTLLGDAAHPMQPNLGQGGCMAIEDCYRLILELDKVAKHGNRESDVISALRSYENKRMPRVMIFHSVSRMASQVLVNYRPYIEVNLWPLSQDLNNMQIKHPCIHLASALLEFTFPQFVDWMIAGHGAHTLCLFLYLLLFPLLLLLRSFFFFLYGILLVAALKERKMSELLFDDLFKVLNLDPDGKKYDKVSRIVARSEKCDMHLLLDVNTEIYPLNKDEKFLMVLSPSLVLNTKDGPVSIQDKFEYIMHGRLYNIEHDGEPPKEGSKTELEVEVYASFGGLQMKLKGHASHCLKFAVDQKLFLLIRKVEA
ncbi:hypothetical protein RIF29_13593 [Crotalaria pallida]|uniref:FAD-binding domain-containing protein n=1 Tax=Crotalaria pallida TaxID=3830 RepID=A0AAN9IPG2_CROPI